MTTTKEDKMSVPKIYNAIAAIQAGVGNIPKSGVGPASQGSYKYVKNDDILEAISKLMIENKVITRPNIKKHDLVTREIGANRFVSMTIVELEVTYISLEDGSEFVTTVIAEGADNGDKGGRKAVTQAQKIANLLTFNIATGEPDPDGMEVSSMSSDKTPVQKRIATASSGGPTKIYNEIKAFLGANELAGSVANGIGNRISGGNAEWMKDEKVLAEVLKALKNGEIE
jgi:hypothetical protein|tara:strand:+ start:245 stop:928 length:684 start_codon:yes stop_codon:yes gene_type:complete